MAFINLPDDRPLTLAAIAERTGYSLSRLRFVVLSRGLQPVGRHGRAHTFDRATVEEIITEADRIEAQQFPVRGGH